VFARTVGQCRRARAIHEGGEALSPSTRGVCALVALEFQAAVQQLTALLHRRETSIPVPERAKLTLGCGGDSRQDRRQPGCEGHLRHLPHRPRKS
jgi:hypothetical protein